VRSVRRGLARARRAAPAADHRQCPSRHGSAGTRQPRRRRPRDGATARVGRAHALEAPGKRRGDAGSGPVWTIGCPKPVARAGGVRRGSRHWTASQKRRCRWPAAGRCAPGGAANGSQSEQHAHGHERPAELQHRDPPEPSAASAATSSGLDAERLGQARDCLGLGRRVVLQGMDPRWVDDKQPIACRCDDSRVELWRRAYKVAGGNAEGLGEATNGL